MSKTLYLEILLVLSYVGIMLVKNLIYLVSSMTLLARLSLQMYHLHLMKYFF